MSNKAKEYYNSLLNFDALSEEAKNRFLTTRGLQDKSYNDIVRIYKNSKFREAFGNQSNYDQLKALPVAQRDRMLQEDAAYKTRDKFFNEGSIGAEFANRIKGLTPQGVEDLINSDWDVDDYIHMPDMTSSIITGTAIGSTIGGILGGTAGAAAGGVGAVPGAAAGAWSGGALGAKAGFWLGLASKGIETYWNNNTNSKLEEIIARDNDRKSQIASEILPQVSTLLDNVINGSALKDEDSRVEAMPVIQALQAYGIDVNKGEGSDINKIFDKVIGQHTPYWEMFKDRHELSDITEGDKLAMVQDALAVDLTFQDGGYSSNSINSQKIQNHVSNNQSWDDWAYNTGRNLVVGTFGALGETVAGTAALGAYAIDKANEAGNYLGISNPTNYTKQILEGKDEYGNEMPLLLNLSYWDGADKFNTFDSDLIKRIRENGGISPFNNVALAGEEGKFFSWQSLNEAIRMGKYAAATRITSGILGATSKNLSKFTAGTSKALGASATTSEAIGTFTGKFGAMGTYLAAGVPVSAGYGLGAYEDVKAEFSNKEDERQAKILFNQYLESEEYKNKVGEVEKQLSTQVNKDGTITNLYTEEGVRELAESKVQAEMAKYFSDFVKNNREDLAILNPDFKEGRDNIDRIAVDAYALDATIEGAKNTFVNLNFRSYLFNKGTTEMIKGEATTPVRYNFKTGKLEQVSKGINGEDIPSNVRVDIGRAIGKQLWGGFFSNYTDDITTGFVEEGAKKRYDNYLDQRYNGKAAGSLASYIGNLYDVANASLQGAETKARDVMSWYDGFIGALGSAAPGSGGYFSLSPYNTTNNKRTSGSKVLEKVLRTTGIGATAYDTYYQNKTTAAEVNNVNKILKSRKMDLLDLLDFASATNTAEISGENGPLRDAKTDKARALLTSLLYIERNKNNPVVMAAPQLQRWHELLKNLRDEDFVESDEYNALVSNLASEFLSQSENKDIASLPKEEAMKKASDRVRHNLDKAKSIINSLDEVSAELKRLNPKASPDAIGHMATLKVMADQYQSRISDIESSLGLEEGSTMNNPLSAEGMLARHSTRTKLQKRLAALESEHEYAKSELSNVQRSLKTAKGSNKTELRHQRDLLMRLIDENLLEQEAAHSAINKYFSEGNENSNKVLSKEEIMNLDATSRSIIMSHTGLNSAGQRKVVSDIIKEYENQKGITSPENLFIDLDSLKDSYESNMEVYSDNKKSPELLESRIAKKQALFRKALDNSYLGSAAFDIAKKVLPLKQYVSLENPDPDPNPDIISELHKSASLEVLKYMQDKQEFAPLSKEIAQVIEFKEESEKTNDDILDFIEKGSIIEEEDRSSKITFAATLDYLSQLGIDTLSDEALEALTRYSDNGEFPLSSFLSQVEDNFHGSVKLASLNEAIQLFKNIINSYKAHKAELDSNTKPIEVGPTTEEDSAPKPAPEPVSTEVDNKPKRGKGFWDISYDNPEGDRTESDNTSDKQIAPDSKDRATSDNPILEAFNDNSSKEVADAAKIAFNIINNTPKVSSETKSEAKSLVEKLSNNSYDSVEELVDDINKIANARELQSEDGTSEISNLLRQVAAKVNNLQTNNKKDTREPSRNETSLLGKSRRNITEEQRRLDKVYDMYPNATYTSSFIATVNIDFLRHNKPDNSIVSYYDKYHIEEAIQNGVLEGDPEIFFMTDSELENSVKQGYSSYDANIDIPIIVAVESKDGQLKIDGKSYQPVGVMASTKQPTEGTPEQRQRNEWSAGAAHLKLIRDLAQPNKGTTQLIRTKDGKPLISKMYGSPKAYSVDVNNRDRNSVIEVGINGLSQSERQQVQSVDKSKRRNSFTYQKVKSNFLKRLKTKKSDIENRKVLFYEQPTLNGKFNHIEVFTYSINETTARDSNITFDQAATSNDASAVINFNSRTRRAAAALGNFIELFSTDGMIFDVDSSNQLVPSTSTKAALLGMAQSLEKTISNFINVPISNGWTYSIAPSTEVIDGNRVMNIDLINENTKEIIPLTKIYAGMPKESLQAVEHEFLKNLIMDGNSVRMIDNVNSFAKWNVPYQDVENSKNKNASDNISDIYDDGILAVPATELNYRIRGIAVKNPLKDDYTPIFTQVANPNNAKSVPPVTKPTVTANNQTKSGKAIVDSESGTVLQGTPEATKSPVLSNVERVVNQIIEDSKNFVLTDDETAYIDNRTKTRYARVTSVKTADEQAPTITKDGKEIPARFDPNSAWATPSTNIGTGIDNLVRDFFDGKIDSLTAKEVSRAYPNITENQARKFIEELSIFRNSLISNGMTIIPRNIVAAGSFDILGSDGKIHKLNVAGTLDLLAYDTNGKVHIFDMKTFRTNINAEKKEGYKRQLSMYAKFLEDAYGLKVASINIIPIHIGKYPTPKGEKEGRRYGVTEYSVSDSKPNQLIVEGRKFVVPELSLKEVINLGKRAELNIIWDKLTDSEREIASVIEDDMSAQTDNLINPVEASIAEPEQPPIDTTLGVSFDDSYLGGMFGIEDNLSDYSVDYSERTTPILSELQWNNITDEQRKSLEMLDFNETQWSNMSDDEMKHQLQCAKNN